MKRLVRCAIAIAICASLCAVFWGLSTQWCVRADGGTRSLGIYVSERPFLHPNNHLLYPIAYYLWKQLAIVGGFLPQTREQWLAYATFPNALSAAISLLLVGRIVHRLTASRLSAVGAVAMYATAYAFLLHATVSSEPMQALPWMWWAISLALANLDEPKPRRALGSAALMAIVYWYYQGYAVLAPGVLGVVILAATDRSIRDPAGWPAIVREAILWCTCFAAGVVTLFYAAHAVVLGNTAVNDLIARMTRMAGITGSTPWAELRFGDVASPLLYGGINLIEIPGFEGVRKCLANPFGEVSLRYWGSTLLWYSVITISAVFLWKLWPGLETRRKRQAASIIWLLVCSFGAPLVIGHYDKFWIPPLGLSIVLLWTLYGWVRERASSGVAVVIPTVLIITVLCVEVGVNLRNALYYHMNPSPDYLAAIDIAKRVQDNDLVVMNWDKAGTYFNAFYPGEARSFSVRQAAIYQSEGSPQRFASILSDLIDEVARNRGRVWIIQLAAIDDAEGVSRFGAYWKTEPIQRIRRQARLEQQWDCREGNLSHTVYLHVVPGESLLAPDATP